MLKQSLHWLKIGDGWVGRSKNGPKIGYPLNAVPQTGKLSNVEILIWNS